MGMNLKIESAILFCLTLGLLTACGEERLTYESLSGEYTLRDIDGNSPPVVFDSSDVRILVVTGGLLTMLPAGEYVMQTDLRVTRFDAGDPTTADSTAWQTGAFTIDEDLLIMETTTTGVFLFATVSGPSILVALPEEGGPGMLVTYVRSGDVFSSDP